MVRYLPLVIITTLWLSATPARAQKIAVVNIAVVSDKYERRVELESTFEKRQTALQTDKKQRMDKIDRGIKALDEDFKPGTDEYLRRQKDLAVQQAELQYDMDAQRKEIERGMAASLRSIYDDIQTVVSEIAKDRGYDLVISIESLSDSPPESPNMVRQQIVLQKAVYWNPSLDITTEVIQRLNTKYRAAKDAQSPGATGGGAAPAAPGSANARPPGTRD